MKKKQYIEPTIDIISPLSHVMETITWDGRSAPEEGDANTDIVWEEEEESTTKNSSLWDE